MPGKSYGNTLEIISFVVPSGNSILRLDSWECWEAYGTGGNWAGIVNE